jgi:hypothetical protein
VFVDRDANCNNDDDDNDDGSGVGGVSGSGVSSNGGSSVYLSGSSGSGSGVEMRLCLSRVRAARLPSAAVLAAAAEGSKECECFVTLFIVALVRTDSGHFATLVSTFLPLQSEELTDPDADIFFQSS